MSNTNSPYRSRSSNSQDWHDYTTLLHTPLSPIHQQHSSSPRYESLSRILLGSDSLIVSQSFLTTTTGEPNHQFALSMDEGSYSSPLRATILSSSTQDHPKRCLLSRYDSPCAIILGLSGIALLGSILAFIFPSEEQHNIQSSSWDVISNILGYSYFLAWTLSFYPQIITNCTHPEKAVRGLSLDFIVWNIIGFALYAVYTTSLRYSAVVRQEYADRFGGGGAVVQSDVPMAYHDPSLTNTTMFNVVINTMFTTINSNSSNSNTTGDEVVAVPQVKTNDVAFAWHALILTIITFIQIIYNEHKVVNRNVEFAELDHRWIDNDEQEGMRLDDSLGNDSFILNEDDFGQEQAQQKQKRTRDRSNSLQTTHFTDSDDQRTKQTHTRWTKRISSTTKILIVALILTCISFGSFIATNVGQFNLLNFLYFLSYVKVGITAVKYIPQVMLNYHRKSTAGWAIWNILLDFTGGSLSIVQLIGDSFAQDGTWTGVLGNPAKLGLGLVSICFDVVFLVQHYVLYRNQPLTVSIHPRNDDDDIGIDTIRSGHDTPLLAGIHSLL
mmetsp:Transcript_14614/g.22524  ORF Transcript_14614/g.22524 Transcript_14614/m.22524 type:complete len:554 (-) Transcript_14614:86-1747(-)